MFKNTMLGAIVGLVIVLAVLTFFFMTDDTMKSAEDVEKEFGIMPLTVIPEGDVASISDEREKEIHKNKKKRRKEKKEMKSIKINNMPDLPYAMEEAVNRLRINISFLGTKIKKIMIISTEPNEGKSFVAMQLWKQIAEAGTPSILLDADMRKSVMADKYEIVSEKRKR